MHNHLSKLRAKRAANGDGGFTLIELLVVVVILGILIAIAIPLYLNYRKGANDASAKSDLRGAISSLEQCNADNSAYPTGTLNLTTSGAIGGGCTTPVSLSSGTSLKYVQVPATSSYYAVTENSKGATKYYCYNSANGGSVNVITPTPASLTAAAC